jgi:hypothetical protein
VAITRTKRGSQPDFEMQGTADNPPYKTPFTQAGQPALMLDTCTTFPSQYAPHFWLEPVHTTMPSEKLRPSPWLSTSDDGKPTHQSHHKLKSTFPIPAKPTLQRRLTRPGPNDLSSRPRLLQRGLAPVLQDEAAVAFVRVEGRSPGRAGAVWMLRRGRPNSH